MQGDALRDFFELAKAATRAAAAWAQAAVDKAQA
jgi:hypothetical protein